MISSIGLFQIIGVSTNYISRGMSILANNFNEVSRGLMKFREVKCVCLEG